MRLRGLKQHDRQDCGIACLATILQYYGRFVSFARLREVSHIDKNGMSLYELTKTAEKYGLHSKALQGNFSDLVDGLKKGELSLPLVAHVIKGKQLTHFVVIKKIKKEVLYLFDPATSHKKSQRKIF